MWSGLGEHVKIWDPLFIYATAEAGNFKFGIQLGRTCQETTFRTKIGGSGLGEHPKKFGPLFISATVEASNFKFGIILCNGKDVHRCE